MTPIGWILIETFSTILFFVFSYTLHFKNIMTPFVMSFGFVNMFVFLFNLFKKTYSPQKILTKKIIFNSINTAYSLFLCASFLSALMNILSFGKKNLHISDLFPLIQLIVSVVFSLYILHLKEKIKSETIKLQATENYIKLLKSQFNPHFLFNILNSLAELVRKSPQKCEEIILKLSNYYRTILKSPQMWSLREEIEFVDKYLELEKSIIYDVQFEYSIKIDDSLKDISVPAMILQPLVENAIKYGIKKNHGGFINVSAKTTEYELIITVENNCADKIDEITFGNGLTITKERVKLLMNGTLDWENTNDTVKFKIKSPKDVR